jgi:hypothetical protein
MEEKVNILSELFLMVVDNSEDKPRFKELVERLKTLCNED